MKEDFVTFEQAVLLKELGFDNDECNDVCDFIYYFTYHNHDTPIFQRYETVDYYEIEKFYYAPTLAFTQKWLFEKFGIWIQIERDTIESTMFTCEINHADEIYQKWVGIFENPFDALSEGINEALELLKENIK